MARRGRRSLRDILTAHNAADKYYAALGGKPAMSQAAIAPKRERKPATRSPDEPAPILEREIIRGVALLLGVHPKVLFAVRQNSGSLVYDKQDGKSVPVWFYRLVKRPGSMTITDFWGFTRDGKPFAIECKRESWRGSHTPREKEQLAFIQMIKSIGGRADFATSVEQAQAIIEGAV
jgi:hypothetical protein